MIFDDERQNPGARKVPGNIAGDIQLGIYRNLRFSFQQDDETSLGPYVVLSATEIGDRHLRCTDYEVARFMEWGGLEIVGTVEQKTPGTPTRAFYVRNAGEKGRPQ